MTRGWKTIRNFAVTAAILAAFFWLWGVYLSPETCVLRSMEELGFAPCEIVSELPFPNGNREYLMKNTQGKYAIHGAKRVLGLFWATSGGATGMDFDSREELSGLLHMGRRGGQQVCAVQAVRPGDRQGGLVRRGRHTLSGGRLARRHCVAARARSRAGRPLHRVVG